MTPQKQTKIDDLDDKGRHIGNCLSACVASLYDMPLDEVPWFITYKKKAYDILHRFSKENGYMFYGTIDNPTKGQLQNHKGIDGYSIVGGKSPRGNWRHAVIYKNGEPFFDPHPSNAFIEKADRLYVINRI